MATERMARPDAAQTLPCIGFTNEKAPGISGCGFLIMMLIPSSMYGLLNSGYESCDSQLKNV